jgi:hypothetical protein
MSTATGVDAKAYLAGWLQAVTGMTIADINAIPDDKWAAVYGGCARPCGALLADTVTNLKWTAATVRGEASDAYNGMGPLGEVYADKAAAIAGLSEASAELASALAAAGDDHLNSMVTAPWGQQAPVYLLAQISMNHIWYHDGQLNYIQALNGDDQVHWMA